MLTFSEMITDFRNHLDAIGDNFFSDEEIARRLHSAQQEIVRAIQKQSPSFYVSYFDISLVSNQATYDMPLNARLGARVIFSQDTGSAVGGIVPPTVLEALVDADLPSLVNLTDTYMFAFEGNKIRVISTPQSSKSNAIRVWYIPTYGNMLQGSVASATDTTFTLGSTQLTPDYTTYYGKLDLRNDFYNGMEVVLTDGTGVGQQRLITDYDGATKTFTVDTWDTNPDTTTTFYVMCPVPEDHHHLVPVRAALTGAVKNRNRQEELAREYYGAYGRLGGLAELISWVSERQESRMDVVQPYDIGE